MNITQMSFFTNINNKFAILTLSRRYNIGIRIDSESRAFTFTINGYDKNVADFVKGIMDRKLI
jgi:hypothetical protein